MDTYKATMFPIYLAFLIFFWIGLSDFIRISYINTDPEVLLKVKKRKISRIPLTCIFCMYLYLLTVTLRLFRFQNSLLYGIQFFDFICMFMVICILYALNLTTVRTLRRIGMTQQIKNSWIALKLAFIPFLPLNVWLFDKTTDYIKPEIIGYAVALIIFLPILILLMFLIAIFFPVVINVANSCIGISYIYYLRKQPERKQPPSVVHFVLQMFPGLDLISMLFILIKYRETSINVKNTENDSATAHSPCSAHSPHTGKSAHVTEPRIYKKIKKHRRFLFLLYLLCGILFYFGSEIAEFAAEMYEEFTSRFSFIQLALFLNYRNAPIPHMLNVLFSD